MRSSHVGWLSCVVIAVLVALLFSARPERQVVVTEVTLVPVATNSDKPLPSVYRFEVIAGPLLIRDAPDGTVLDGRIGVGETFTADLMDQHIFRDMVWIKHEHGYSALHSVDGSQRFVRIVGVLPQPAVQTQIAPDFPLDALPPTFDEEENNE